MYTWIRGSSKGALCIEEQGTLNVMNVISYMQPDKGSRMTYVPVQS